MIPKLTEAIKHIIIINTLMFVAPMLLNMDLTNITDLHFLLNENFGIWQYLTSIFMHGSWEHLIFNMIGLWMFGSAVEEYLGKQRFLFLYFSAGIGAGLIYSLVNYFQFNEALNTLIQTQKINQSEIMELMDATKVYRNELLQIVNLNYNKVAVGASGAIFGIFAGFATFFPNREILIFPLPFPIKSIILVILLVISDLVLGTFSLPGDNVGRFAHVGGALMGFIITWYWKKK